MDLSFIVPVTFDGRPLRDYLRWAGVSATLIKGVKNQGGGFWIGDEPARTCDTVHTGQMVTFALPPEPPTTVQPQDIPLEIVYETAHTMVLEKISGMAVHPTLNYKEGTLANAYMGHLAKKGQTGVFRPVNRLDKDTSGLVLCAKNAYAAPLLAQSAQKVYRAVVQGRLPAQSGVIDAPIDRAPGSIILRCVAPGGKASRTEYALEAQGGGFSLVRAVPVTGRTHQLRVHFAHLGCPLAGDELYGGSREKILRHALHCSELSFIEPGTDRLIQLKSALAQDINCLVQQMEIT